MWRNRLVSEGTESPDQLLANPANYRIHPANQQSALKASLSEIGWVQRVLVNQNTGHVIDGHARIELAISNGEQAVPVTYLDLTEDEERLILATYDPISAMAVHDQELLNDLIKDISTESEALQELLDDLSTDAQVVGQTDEDSVPEVKEDPKSERGKIYLLGRHRVMCGDSTDEADVELLMNGQKADMVFTDPPYGIGEAAGKNKSRGSLAKAKDYGNSAWDNNIVGGLVDNILCCDVPSIVFGGNYYPFPPSSCWLVWDKENGANDFADCELAWTNLSGAVRLKRHIWKGMIRKGHEERSHPTQKPLEVVEWCLSFVEAGSVFDMFLGSGTTTIACEKLNRTCYGMEIDPHYVDVIRKRWAEFVHGVGCDWEALTPVE